MPERLIRPRRPEVWNRLLRKGHVHQPSRSAQRGSARRALDDEVEEYYRNRDVREHGNMGPSAT